MHKLMENFSREMEIIKRNQIEIPEIKNIISTIKNIFISLTVDY